MEKDLPSWPRLAIAAALVVGLGVGVAGTAVVVGMADGERPQVIDPGAISLVAYDSCDSALNELRAAALPNVGPYGWGAGDEGVVARGGGIVPDAEMQAEGAAPREGDAAGSTQDKAAAPEEAAPGHSGTNNYESDVDEPDIVKTDGRRVVSIVDGQLRVVDAASHKQTAKLALPSGYATQLLISGDRALVLTTAGVAMPTPREGGVVPEPVPVEPTPGAKPGGDPASPPIDTPPVDPAFGSQLVLVDLTGAGKVLGTLAVEGSYLDARQVGTVARVVVRSTPRLKFTYPDVDRSPDDAEEENHRIVESSSISDWLPRYQLSAGGHVSSGELVDCTAVSHPEQYTGSGLLTVLTLDLRRQLGTGTPISIAADGNTVYGTGTNLYVADDHFAHGGGPTERPAPDGGGQRTEIYQFDISGSGKPRHVASGGVDGGLLNQYSLSEHEGHLRVATTVGGMEAESHSMVSVLTRRGNQLAQVGRIDGLGKGERIYAVRYLGDTAYVVTFRQTDPLYTVDLSEPSQPRVTGELKITGYSAYLHPVGDGRLLGVGQEATVQGSTTGTQVSLFDTSNQRGAKRVSQVHFEGGHSEVEGDPHAFLYWPEKDLVVLPMAVMSDPAAPGTGAVVLKVSGDTLTQVGTLRHEGAVGFAPRRAMVIGDELWTVSQAGMLVSDLDRLTQVAWLPFT